MSYYHFNDSNADYCSNAMPPHDHRLCASWPPKYRTACRFSHQHLLLTYYILPRIGTAKQSFLTKLLVTALCSCMHDRHQHSSDPLLSPHSPLQEPRCRDHTHHLMALAFGYRYKYHYRQVQLQLWTTTQLTVTSQWCCATPYTAKRWLGYQLCAYFNRVNYINDASHPRGEQCPSACLMAE